MIHGPVSIFIFNFAVAVTSVSRQLETAENNSVKTEK
jgi:hypothetical protein